MVRVLLVAVLAAATCAPALAQVPAKPLATATTNWDGVSIDLMSVERKGSVLTVKWAVRNQGSKQATVQFGLTGDNSNTYVVDEESGTKYYALTDKEKHVVASEHVYAGGPYGISDYAEAGSTARHWAEHPSPPPQVKSLTVFFSNTEPFESVPIVDR